MDEDLEKRIRRKGGHHVKTPLSTTIVNPFASIRKKWNKAKEDTRKTHQRFMDRAREQAHGLKKIHKPIADFICKNDLDTLRVSLDDIAVFSGEHLVYESDDPDPEKWHGEKVYATSQEGMLRIRLTRDWITGPFIFTKGTRNRGGVNIYVNYIDEKWVTQTAAGRIATNVESQLPGFKTPKREYDDPEELISDIKDNLAAAVIWHQRQKPKRIASIAIAGITTVFMWASGAFGQEAEPANDFMPIEPEEPAAHLVMGEPQ